MNDELIKRIDERFTSLNDVPVRDVRLTREEWALIRPHISDCRAALSRKYVPMTDEEWEKVMWTKIDKNHSMMSYEQLIESAVIRRAGLEVVK